MPFTGELIHGWRVARDVAGRNTHDGTGRWVDEVVIELVKGQRHIRATGEHGIDPAIVLGRAVSAALKDDIREAQERQDGVEILRLVRVLDAHEQQREVRENGWAARRALARMKGTPAVFAAGTASARG